MASSPESIVLAEYPRAPFGASPNSDVHHETWRVFLVDSAGDLTPAPEEACDLPRAAPSAAIDTRNDAAPASSQWMRERLPQPHRLGALQEGHGDV